MGGRGNAATRNQTSTRDFDHVWKFYQNSLSTTNEQDILLHWAFDNSVVGTVEEDGKTYRLQDDMEYFVTIVKEPTSEDGNIYFEVQAYGIEENSDGELIGEPRLLTIPGGFGKGYKLWKVPVYS